MFKEAIGYGILGLIVCIVLDIIGFFVHKEYGFISRALVYITIVGAYKVNKTIAKENCNE